MLRTSHKLEIDHLNLKAAFQKRHRRMLGLSRSFELASARSFSKIVLKCLCFDET